MSKIAKKWDVIYGCSLIRISGNKQIVVMILKDDYVETYSRNCPANKKFPFIVNRKFQSLIFQLIWYSTTISFEGKEALAESFYNVKYGLSIITSESSSENLINECFCFFKTKSEFKCQKELKKQSVCFHYWDCLTNFLT